MIDSKKAAALGAQARSRPIGWGEQILAQWLVDRGETPDAQRPSGTRNIDLALHPVAMEVWASASFPFHDPYCRERIKDLADQGWTMFYVHVRNQILLPTVADQIVEFCQLSRSNPASPREHRVVRGCGELAAVSGDDLDHVTVIPPSKSCPYHSRID